MRRIEVGVVYLADQIDKYLSMRWGIESLFSDFKSRGFGITKTQLKYSKRIEKLILLLFIATYWAVSTDLYAKHHD